MKKLSYFLTIFCLLVCLGIPTINTVSVQAATTKLNKKTATLIKGQKATLKLKNAKGKIVWTSSNRKVATVSKKGVVTSKNKGTAIITAKNKKRNYRCRIAVQTPTLNHRKATITVGQTLLLKFHGTTQKARWRSSNRSVATITSKGRVKAVKAGFTTINADLMGITYTCKITVNPSHNTNKPSDDITSNYGTLATYLKTYGHTNTTGGKFINGVDGEYNYVLVYYPSEQKFIFALTEENSKSMGSLQLTIQHPNYQQASAYMAYVFRTVLGAYSGTGALNINTYTGKSEIPLNLENCVGLSSAQAQKHASLFLDLLLACIGSDIYERTGITLSDLGFKHWSIS